MNYIDPFGKSVKAKRDSTGEVTFEFIDDFDPTYTLYDHKGNVLTELDLAEAENMGLVDALYKYALRNGYSRGYLSRVFWSDTELAGDIALGACWFAVGGTIDIGASTYGSQLVVGGKYLKDVYNTTKVITQREMIKIYVKLIENHELTAKSAGALYGMIQQWLARGGVGPLAGREELLKELNNPSSPTRKMLEKIRKSNGPGMKKFYYK